MANVASGNGDIPEYANGVAAVTLGPSLGNDGHPAIITTTATGANVELSELLGGSDLLDNGANRKPVSQTLMETREDFHTHPRSLALAHMQLADWRGQDKLRTVGSLLVVCLHLGIEPPDSVRPKKSAVLEAWVDPTAPVQVPTPEELALQATTNNGVQRSAARERSPIKAIGESLLRQFEQLHRHAKYKPLMECVMEDLRKHAKQFRSVAKGERLMFYYNGHGVPRPTLTGDLWVFNRQYTQYIPVGTADLMSWIGTPCIYIWDCSMAMNIVQAFEKNSKARELEIAKIRHVAETIGIKVPISRTAAQGVMEDAIARVTMALASSQTPASGGGGAGGGGGGSFAPQGSQQQGQGHQQQQQQQQQQQAGQGQAPVNTTLINLALLPAMHHEDIHFAATRSDELLPTNPELPADLFTACLTTPIKVALRFWVIRNPRSSKVKLEMCEQVPGSVMERRTPIGELNWIFTSITDTIAWSILPREMFRKLFRQDVAVATLYRNFMLADRVMRFYGVHPQVTPSIPATHKHPLWDSLDLEIDMCLQQLPRLLREAERKQQRDERLDRSQKERVARTLGRQPYPAAVATANAAGAAANGGVGAPVPPAPLPEFSSPLGTNLEIVGNFVTMSCRHGSRIGLGGTIESEDDESDSGSDSDGGGGGGGGGRMSPGNGEWQQATGYISSSYFSNQLYAFEVWLQHAATVVSQFVSDRGPDQTPRSLSTERPANLDPPDELPAVLQVLLSQQYRLRALILLYRFMNLGPWAVDLALAVGIYPYMTKLLASTTTEIREILILVWARLSAVDMALHPDLMKREGLDYFVGYLVNNIQMQGEAAGAAAVSEKVRLCDTVCAASAFTLAMLCRDNFDAQLLCFDERVLDYFLVYLQRPDNGTEERACLCTWIILCLAELWKTHPNAKWMAVMYKLCVIASKKEEQQQNSNCGAPSFEELLASSAEDHGVDACNAQDLLIQMTFHRAPVVRASAVYAMGTLAHELTQLGDDAGVLAIVRRAERQMYAALLQAAGDGSPMVRREVVHAIGGGVFATYMAQAVEAVARVVGEEVRDEAGARPKQQQQQQQRRAVAGDDLLFPQMYKTLLRLSADAHPDVALAAREACDVLMQCYAHSQAFFDAEAQLDQALHRLEISRSAAGQAPILGFLRSTAGVGDALLGQPRSEAEAEAGTGTETETGTESPSQSSSQSRNQQRRQSAHSHFHAATPTAGLPPRRAVGQVQQQQQQHGRVVAAQAEVPHAQSHRYTMHFAPMVREALLREPIKSPERKKALPPAVADAWLAWGRRELRAQASTLVDWAGAHFTEFDISLFANVSGPLRGSAALAESRERARRVARMEASARAMGAGAGQMKWVDVAAVAAGAAGASAALLHPVEPHAVVATRLGSVAVYDWERGAQVAQWGIGPRGGRHAAAGDVCALHLLNPLGQAKLLVGTADGMVRVFASHAPDFAPPPAPIGAVFPRPRLLTAFMALPWASSDPPPPHRYGLAPATVVTSNQRMRALQGTTRQLSALEGAHHAGLQHPAPAMATAWNQRSGVLFAGGGGKEVRVWDVAAELCIEEIAVAPTGGVTCISHDGVSGNIFATGSAAGVVRVMDRRVDARAGMVANWREHAPSRICGVAMRPGHTEVVSAAASGEVKFWDLRHRDAMHTIEATHAEDVGGLRHMLAHEHAHVTLTASASTVKLWNQRGSNIGVVTGAKHTYGSAASYMKSLAGYGPPRRAAAAVAAAAAVPVEPGASVAAVAMHTYLPVALMVTDDGRVSYIRPSKGSSSSASASSARGSGGGGGSSYPHHPPSLASTRASSIL